MVALPALRAKPQQLEEPGNLSPVRVSPTSPFSLRDCVLRLGLIGDNRVPRFNVFHCHGWKQLLHSPINEFNAVPCSGTRVGIEHGGVGSPSINFIHLD